MAERKPSEIIQDFLDLVDRSHQEFEDAKSKVQEYNSRTYEWTHKLEDASNKSERNKLSTAWHRELRERRIQKDRMRLWEKVHVMFSDASNKAYVKRMRHLLEEQKRSEEYLDIPPKEREYKGGKK